MDVPPEGLPPSPAKVQFAHGETAAPEPEPEPERGGARRWWASLVTFEYLPRPIDFISNCPAQSNVRTTACRVCDIACDAWKGRAVAVTQVNGWVGYGSHA